MYRSISTNRVSDDQFSYYSSSSPSSKVPTALRAFQHGGSELPMYEPMSESAKKERTNTSFAEKAVHAIPFVLLLCAFILWIFSDPDIDVKGINSIAGNINGGKGELASDGIGHLPDLHLGDLRHPAKLTTILSQKIS